MEKFVQIRPRQETSTGKSVWEHGNVFSSYYSYDSTT
jgi:hypothetical protein